MVKVSIIMPVYNGSKFIKTSIESVLSQTMNDIEIICVDDGSEDNSLDLLKEYESKHECIRVFSQENQGSGKARNYGMDEAQGEYIGFIDADDIFVDKDSLELLYKKAVENDADIVSGNLKKMTQDRKLIDNPNCVEGNYYCFDRDCVITPEEYGVPWAFYKNLYKKSFMDENDIRFRDLIRGQDPVFMADALSKVDKVYGVKTDFYAYMFPVPGKPYLKVNNSLKKLHYTKHYKDTFDIYENAGMYGASEKYKPKLIKYFNYSIKEDDLEIFEIAMNLFGSTNDYFVNFQEDFDKFKIHHILNKIDIKSTEEYYTYAKEEISKIDIATNSKLTNNHIRKLLVVLNSETYEDYRYNSTVRKNNMLAKKNERLAKDLEKTKKLNQELENSSSWKITEPLRKIMDKFRS
ncbi:glycosyltransferase family 2 protein [Methanobrevibacter sp.]